MVTQRANTLRENWESYERDVLPAAAPPVQRIETRRAFYAGAAAYHGLMTGPIIEMSDDAVVQVIDGWSEELRTFSALVSRGKA